MPGPLMVAKNDLAYCVTHQNAQYSLKNWPLPVFSLIFCIGEADYLIILLSSSEANLLTVLRV
jgi:hypothetical protein